MLDLSGLTLGNLIAAALSSQLTPPTPVPFATEPTPPPSVPSPTAMELAAYSAALVPYQAYQTYLAQLKAYNAAVSANAATWIVVSNQILTYISQNAVVETPNVTAGAVTRDGAIY